MNNIQSLGQQLMETFAQLQANPRKMTEDELKAECRRQKEEETRRLRQINIPTRLQQASSELGNSTPALQRTQQYLTTEAPHGHCLILAGPTGAGKSYAAAAALRAWKRPLP